MENWFRLWNSNFECSHNKALACEAFRLAEIKGSIQFDLKQTNDGSKVDYRFSVENINKATKETKVRFGSAFESEMMKWWKHKNET